jgi:phospholipid transport system substrate-binding protein
MRKSFFSLAVLSILLLTAGAARAETGTAFVKSILDQVMAIQNNPALAGEAKETARAEAIRRVIRANFDFPMMAQSSLGPTYARLGGGQKKEFTDIFSYLFEDSYTRLVLNFLKKETIKYHKEIPEGQKATVKTSIMRTNETIPVDYQMHRRGSGWVLYDVIVDGVSILENYRARFGQEIQTHGFASLLAKMRQQNKAMH